MDKIKSIILNVSEMSKEQALLVQQHEAQLEESNRKVEKTVEETKKAGE